MSEQPGTCSSPEEWECPACEKIQFVGDAFEFERGSEVECEYCGRVSEITEIEYDVTWYTRLKPKNT